MADGFIQMHDDGPGKRVDNTVFQRGGFDIYRQRVEASIAAGQSLGSGDITIDAWGAQKVSLPRSLFHGMFTFDVPQTKWFMYVNGTQVYSSSDITSTAGAGKRRRRRR